MACIWNALESVKMGEITTHLSRGPNPPLIAPSIEPTTLGGKCADTTGIIVERWDGRERLRLWEALQGGKRPAGNARFGLERLSDQD
jgi:hypothetical protein